MAALRRLFGPLAIVLLMLSAAGPAYSQGDGERAFGSLPDGFGQFGDFGGGLTDEGESLQLESFIVPAAGEEPALLVLRAKMATGWHVYSLTQKPGGPPRTEITLEKSDQFQLLEGFRAKEQPKKRKLFETWPEVEEHYGQVTWVAPIRFTGGMVPVDLEIKGELTEGQVCNDEVSCIPFDQLETKFTATLANEKQIASVRPPAPNARGEFHDAENNVVIRGHIEPQVVVPGATAKLVVTIEPQDDWHVYVQADEVPNKPKFYPTLIPLVSTSGLNPQRPLADSKVIEKQDVRYQEGTTTWTIDFPIPANAEAGDYKIEGHLGYQVCTDKSCKSPSGVQFRGVIQIGDESRPGQTPLGIDEASYGSAKHALANSIAWHEPDGEQIAAIPTDFWAHVFGEFGFEKVESGRWGAFPGEKKPATSEPLWGMTFSRAQLIWLCGGLSLLVSFAAGLILNVMPCVLPVVGLKIMSFAQQGGESRMRVFTLNLWYALGLLAVFLAIATFAAALHMLGQTLAWGEHLGDPRFAVPLLALVFVLGLSMFGVWEIPIPGFAGSGAASELASKEGPLGAFFKGVLTTILATPCGGSFIGLAVGIAVIAPIWLNYTIFTCMAIGMAAPYLIVGAFPKLIGFIPKPGPWMDTFKQFMGFVLMATAVWIISFLQGIHMLAALAMLVGLGIVCWMVGRIPLTATRSQKLKRYATTAVVAALSILTFFWMLPSNQLDWQEFSRASLDERVDQGHAVLVDFTADW